MPSFSCQNEGQLWGKIDVSCWAEAGTGEWLLTGGPLYCPSSVAGKFRLCRRNRPYISSFEMLEIALPKPFLNFGFGASKLQRTRRSFPVANHRHQTQSGRMVFQSAFSKPVSQTCVSGVGLVAMISSKRALGMERNVCPHCRAFGRFRMVAQGNCAVRFGSCTVGPMDPRVGKYC